MMHFIIYNRIQMSKLFLSHKQLYRMSMKKHNPIFKEFEEYPQIGIPMISKKIEDVSNFDKNNKFSEDKDNINESSNDSLDKELNKIELQKLNIQKSKKCIKKSCLSPVSVSDIDYIKKNLKVKFLSTVNVILIPCRKEYIDVALDKLLWYSLMDYQYFLECEISRNIDKKIDLIPSK